MPGVYPRGREGGRGPRGFSALSGLTSAGKQHAHRQLARGQMGAWPPVTCTQGPGVPPLPLKADRGPAESLTLKSLAAALSLTKTC